MAALQIRFPCTPTLQDYEHYPKVLPITKDGADGNFYRFVFAYIGRYGAGNLKTKRGKKMTLELKYKKAQALLVGVTPRSDMPEKEEEGQVTAVTLSLKMLVKPDILDQLSGEPMHFGTFFWQDNGTLKVSGMKPVEFNTKFDYQKLRLTVDAAGGSEVVASAAVTDLIAAPKENLQIELKFKLKFQCSEDFIGHASGQLNRQTGVGVQFLGENKEAKKAATNQGELNLPED